MNKMCIGLLRHVFGKHLLAICIASPLFCAGAAAAEDPQSQPAAVSQGAVDPEIKALLDKVEQQVINGRTVAPETDNALVTWGQMLSKVFPVSPGKATALKQFAADLRLDAGRESVADHPFVIADLTLFANLALQLVADEETGLSTSAREPQPELDPHAPPSAAIAPTASSQAPPPFSGRPTASSELPPAIVSTNTQSPAPARPDLYIAASPPATSGPGVMTHVEVPATANPSTHDNEPPPVSSRPIATSDGPAVAASRPNVSAEVPPPATSTPSMAVDLPQSRPTGPGVVATAHSAAPAGAPPAATTVPNTTALLTPPNVARPDGSESVSPTSLSRSEPVQAQIPANSTTLADVKPGTTGQPTLAADATPKGAAPSTPAPSTAVTSEAQTPQTPKGNPPAVVAALTPIRPPEERSAQPPARQGVIGSAPATTDPQEAVYCAGRGDEMLAIKDISAARKYYECAAEAGSARAAVLLAQTYDPKFVAKIGAIGIRPDTAAAVIWYRRAAVLGDKTAESRLQSMRAEAAK